MKLAIVKDGPLLPIKDGASYKIYNLALEYQKNGIEVFFILIDRGWIKEADIINSGIKNFILINPDWVYNSSRITGLLNELKVDCVKTNIPELIITKSLEWSPFHIIFDSHDILYEQSLQKEESLEKINIEKFIDYAAGTIADTIFCCTKRDKKMYQDLGLKSNKIFVIENGTNIDKTINKQGDGSVIFLGHLFYEPNYQATLNLFAIAGKSQNITFNVVGNYPKELEEKKPKNVNLLGYIKNISPILKRASVAIAPIDSGSGSRIKILDYLASGLNVISSTIGASGLESLHDFIRIEDNYDKYPSLIEEMINSAPSKNLNSIINKYSYRVLGDKATKIILERVKTI